MAPILAPQQNNQGWELLQTQALPFEIQPQVRASCKAEQAALPGDKPCAASSPIGPAPPLTSSEECGAHLPAPQQPRSVHSFLHASLIHSANAHQGPAVSQALS